MIKNIKIKSSVIKQISPTTTEIVELNDTIPYSKAGYRVFSSWAELKNIEIVTWIYSLEKVPFPIYSLEDSESKQTLDAINLEWKSPRIELEMLFTVDDGETWFPVRKFSLINNDPFPYRRFEVEDFSLGDNAKIGFRTRNVGNGLLSVYGSFEDSVVIHADLVRHVNLEKLVSGVKVIANSIGTSANLIVPANSNRSGISFFNTSSADVYLDFVDTVSSESYAVLLEAEDYYEPVTAGYTGDYYAIASVDDVSISIREYE